MICAGEQYDYIFYEAIDSGIPMSKIFSYKALFVAGFKLEQYMRLKNARISIMANNCWGGLTYNTLAWEFLSPLIGLYVPVKDFIKLVSDPMKYFAVTPSFSHMEINCDGQRKTAYPVYKIMDVELHMVHEKQIDAGIDKWEYRKKRINWENMFVSMFTEDKKEAECFEELPYKNKICFVSFASDLPSSYQLFGPKRYTLWSKVTESAKMSLKNYDILDLLDGKIQRSKRVDYMDESAGKEQTANLL